jgi:hypothetical protein
LTRDGGGEHQATLGDREDSHAFLIDAMCRRVILACAHPGVRAIGRGARIGACRDGHDAGIRTEFEVSGLKLVQRAFILEEDDLAVGFASRR